MNGRMNNIEKVEQIISIIIKWLELVQNCLKIAAHFIPLPDFLTSGETYLIAKIIITILAEIYISVQMSLPYLPLVLRRVQNGWKQTRVICSLRHHVRAKRRKTKLRHHVRRPRPVSVLPVARMGRQPKTKLPLCRIIRPSPREKKRFYFSPKSTVSSCILLSKKTLKFNRMNLDEEVKKEKQQKKLEISLQRLFNSWGACRPVFSF